VGDRDARERIEEGTETMLIYKVCACACVCARVYVCVMRLLGG